MQGIFWRHVNVTKRADYPHADAYCAFWSLNSYARAVFNIAGLADRGLDAKLELFGHGDFYLSLFARGAEHSHPVHLASRSDQVQLLLAGILTRL